MNQCAKYAAARRVSPPRSAPRSTPGVGLGPALGCALALAVVGPASIAGAQTGCDARREGPPVKVRHVNPESLFESDAYSSAVVVPPGPATVHISGQIPVSASYEVLGDDLRGQVGVALDNLCEALAAAGVSADDVIRLNVQYVYETPRDPFVISEELKAFFAREDMPATTMAGVSHLIVDGIRVQVDAVAVGAMRPKVSN